MLLREVLKGAEVAGGNCEYLSLRDKQMSPCVECNWCYGYGRCRIQDDFQDIMPKMVEADVVVFATPTFFMAVCASGKILIDRCQCLWARKYVLKKPLYDPPRPDRKGVLIAAGATRGKRLFDGVKTTIKYYFDVLELQPGGHLLYRGLDEKAAVLNHPTAMKEAYELGTNLASE